MANVSSFSGAMPVIPGGTVELGYSQITANVNVTSTTAGSSADVVIGPMTVVCDGSPIIVEFSAPFLMAGSGTGENYVTLFEDGVEKSRYLGVFTPPSATTQYVPIRLAFRTTPSAGSHTYQIRSYHQYAGTSTIGAGSTTTGNAPAFLRVSKIVNQNDGLKPFWTPPVVTSLPSQATEGDQVLLRYAATGGGQGLWTYNSGAWRPAGGLHLIQTKTASNVSSISFDSVFTALFDSYRITGANLFTTGGGDQVWARLRASGSDNSANNYDYGAQYLIFGNSTPGNYTVANTNLWTLCYARSGANACSFSFDVHYPAKANHTTFTGTANNHDSSTYNNGVHDSATAFDGLTVGGTGLSGVFSVYGYAKETSA